MKTTSRNGELRITDNCGGHESSRLPTPVLLAARALFAFGLVNGAAIAGETEHSLTIERKPEPHGRTAW